MVTDRPLAGFLSWIRERRPFTYSRWADVHWHTLYGEPVGQVPNDGMFYFKPLCRALAGVLDACPGYWLGLHPTDALADRAEQFILDCGHGGLDWVRGGFDDGAALLAVARVSPWLAIGPPDLRAGLRCKTYVTVPPKNPYLNRQEILGNVLAALERFRGPVLVTVAAGVVGPILVDLIHKRTRGRNMVVDVGDLWEALCQPMTPTTSSPPPKTGRR
jgi:hypothetical protein